MNVQRELHEAVRSRNLSRVRQLVEEHGADPHQSEEQWEGKTPLLAACSRAWRDYDIAEYLLKKQCVSVDVRDERYGVTPLHWAVVGSDNIELVKLVAKGEGATEAVKAEDQFGRTPLHVACEAGGLDVIQYLIEERHAEVQGSVLQFALKNSTDRLEDILGYLLPHCQVDHSILADICKMRRSWEIKTNLVKLCIEALLSHRQNFFFDMYPLQGIFYCPLPTESVYQGFILHLMSNVDVASVLDDQGRLALHVAIEAFIENKERVSPSVIRQVLRLEPRASLVRDRTTGFFPFEAAAVACHGGEELRCANSAEGAQQMPVAVHGKDPIGPCVVEGHVVVAPHPCIGGIEEGAYISNDDEDGDGSVSDDSSVSTIDNDGSFVLNVDDMSHSKVASKRVLSQDDDASWLDLVYQLFRYDPGHLLSCRGLCGGSSSIAECRGTLVGNIALVTLKQED